MIEDKLIFGEEAGDVNIIPVMNVDSVQNLKDSEIPEVLPVLPLRNAILFPDTVIPIPVRREKSIKLLNDANNSNKFVGVITQKVSRIEDPAYKDLFEIGTVGKIIKIVEMPDNTITAIIQGIRRFSISSVVKTDPYMMATVKYIPEIVPDKDDPDIEALAGTIKDTALHIIKLTPRLPQEAGFAIKNIEGFEFLINFIASSVEIDNPLDKFDLLSENSLKERAMKLLEMMNRQIDILDIKADIQRKVKGEIDQQQREYYLNNQLKTIQEELGIDSDLEDFDKFRKIASKKKWPDYAKDTFDKELRKLEKSNPSSPEYNIQYAYVQFLLDLPWEKYSKDNLDLSNAKKVLDREHYGLDTVKERIIEYLAVLKLKNNMKSPILCLYGPPGVGKTSLGKSVAHALGRKYARISLGGLHDESEIRGHRRTYIGAMPGRIIQTIKRAGTSNPVIVLDEIDKVSNDFRGDPSSALLEALDPEQNISFHDNYLDIDYDLSHVLFITTANTISNIQPALLDRMELIEISGYLEEEKVAIAKKYLVPKQIEANGLSSKDLKLSNVNLETIINKYTHESGVRGLEKQIAKVARVTAKKIALDEPRNIKLTTDDIRSYLGLPTSDHDIQSGNEAPGVVTGLAWTQYGGEILFIECSLSEGKGVISITGNVGKVMNESAQLAVNYLKAHPELAGVKPKTFSTTDIHIHAPEGATPKDGPSAGVTIVTAIASAFRKEKIKSGIAMTGEITLRGKVLPVGGIKEKILAAKRAGVKTIVMSRENEKDILDINEIYVKGLSFHYVDTIDDVIDFVFEKKKNAGKN